MLFFILQLCGEVHWRNSNSSLKASHLGWRYSVEVFCVWCVEPQWVLMFSHQLYQREIPDKAADCKRNYIWLEGYIH